MFGQVSVDVIGCSFTLSLDPQQQVLCRTRSASEQSASNVLLMCFAEQSASPWQEEEQLRGGSPAPPLPTKVHKPESSLFSTLFFS